MSFPHGRRSHRLDDGSEFAQTYGLPLIVVNGDVLHILETLPVFRSISYPDAILVSALAVFGCDGTIDTVTQECGNRGCVQSVESKFSLSRSTWYSGI